MASSSARSFTLNFYGTAIIATLFSGAPLASAADFESALANLRGINIPSLATPAVSTNTGATEVFAPCELNTQSNTGLRKCSVAIDAKGAMIDLLQTRLQKQASCLYTPVGSKQGVDLDVSQDPGTGACVGEEFQHPCSIVPTQFTNQVVELNQDYQGRTCGAPAYIQSSVDTHAKKINVVYHYENFQGTALGEWERSHFRGAFVQALDTKWSDVKASLLVRRSVVIKNQGSNPSPCSSLAAVLTRNQNAYQANAASFATQVQAKFGTLAQPTDTAAATANLAAQRNLTDILNCENTSTNSSATDLGSLRQSAQQLCAMRASMENSFTQLAVCESVAEAQYAYLNNIVGPQSKTTASLILALHNYMDGPNQDGPCRKECKDGGTGPANACSQQLSNDCEAKCGNLSDQVEGAACIKAQCLPKTATQQGGDWANGGACGDPIGMAIGGTSTLTTCLNNCYSEQLPVWFKKEMTGLFPRAPQPSPPRQ